MSGEVYKCYTVPEYLSQLVDKVLNAKTLTDAQLAFCKCIVREGNVVEHSVAAYQLSTKVSGG